MFDDEICSDMRIVESNVIYFYLRKCMGRQVQLSEKESTANFFSDNTDYILVICASRFQNRKFSNLALLKRC